MSKEQSLQFTLFNSTSIKIQQHGVKKVGYLDIGLQGLTAIRQSKMRMEEKEMASKKQGCIFRLTCSHRELTKDHVLTSAYVKIFRTGTRNAVSKSV